MIRLAFAIGFLSVFGIVSYGIIALITNKLNQNPEKAEKAEQEQQTKRTTNKK
jgi:hypothetical protein